MLGFFYAAECRQVLKSVKANFGIDILFTIAVHNNTNHDLRKPPLQLGNQQAKNFNG
jgi:hypothetical protein